MFFVRKHFWVVEEVLLVKAETRERAMTAEGELVEDDFLGEAALPVLEGPFQTENEAMAAVSGVFCTICGDSSFDDEGRCTFCGERRHSVRARNRMVMVNVDDLEMVLAGLFRETMAERPHWYSRLAEAVRRVKGE